jgi:hypothetical protein
MHVDTTAIPMDDVSMALMTDHQGLALASSHLLDPVWWYGVPRSVEVPQGSNVMHLDSILGAAELTFVGQEPLE